MLGLVVTALFAKPATSVLLYEPSLIGLPTSSGTPEYIRNQSPRGTCTFFSAAAAMEYAIYRSLGEVVDISEMFTNHVGKGNYLHPNWPDIAAGGPYKVENQLSGTNGGEWLGSCFDGLGMTKESSLLPYGMPDWAAPWGDPLWDNQWNVHNQNLHTYTLPPGLLAAPTYYQAIGYRRLPSPTTTAIEAELNAGRPVVWDFYASGDQSGEIWQPGTAVGGGHSMLIVGYDNTPSSDSQRFFWCKNSWGATSLPYGLTKVSYNYLRTYGIAARVISGAKKSAVPYPYLGFWYFSTKSLTHALAVSHIPGTSLQDWIHAGKGTQKDYRIGEVFFTTGAAEPPIVACRVNGAFTTKGLSYYYSTADVNQSYWALSSSAHTQGWMVPILVAGQYPYMGGFQRPNTGVVEAAYGGKLPFGTSTTGSVGDTSTMPGTWKIHLGDLGEGTLAIAKATATGATKPMALTLDFPTLSARYTGTATWETPTALLPGGPFAVSTPMWVFRLTRTTSPFDSITFVGNKSNPTNMVFSGLTPSARGFVMRQTARL